MQNSSGAGPLVVMAGFMHESNGFTALPSAAESFTVLSGSELEAWVAASSDGELRGASDTLRRRGYRVGYGAYAEGEVGGLIDPAFWLDYLRLLEQSFAAFSGEVAGVFCALHGSASVRDAPDSQAQLVSVLRRYFGAVPIVASLDLHASPSPRLLRSLDAVSAYRTAPHRDQRATGERAAGILCDLVGGRMRGNVAQVRLPLLLPGELGQTDRGPMGAVMALAAAAKQASQSFDISVLQGYPWMDNPYGTVSLTASFASDAPREPIYDALAGLARELWALRSDLYRSVRLWPMEDALTRVRTRAQDELLILCDTGDNPTAGAPEDRIDILRLALERGVVGLCFFPVVDAQAAHDCQGRQGEGVTLWLGRGSGPSGGNPTQIRAHVRKAGVDREVGRFAFVETAGNGIFLCERRVGVRDPGLLARFGVAVKDRAQVLVLKSGYLFPGWNDVLAETDTGAPLLLSSPGATTLDLSFLADRYGAWASAVYPLYDMGNGVEFAWTLPPGEQ